MAALGRDQHQDLGADRNAGIGIGVGDAAEEAVVDDEARMGVGGTRRRHSRPVFEGQKVCRQQDGFLRK